MTDWLTDWLTDNYQDHNCDDGDDDDYDNKDANTDGVQVSLEAMAKAGVHCIKPEYIAMYLSDVPLPSPSASYIPQVMPFLRSAVWQFR